MMAASNWAQLYAESLVDVSDLADEVGKDAGRVLRRSRVVATVGKKWIAMPFTILGVLFANRTSWFGGGRARPSRRPGTNTAPSASR